MWWLISIFFFIPVMCSRCYWNNRNPYPYFGSKTPYDTVRGDFRDVPEIEDCEQISIWFMARHGTRRPDPVDATNMKEASSLKNEILNSHASGKGNMCAQDIADLRDWAWNPKLDDTTSNLTSEGYTELLEIGQRFEEKFSTFLEDLHKHVIRPTSEIRTKKSAEAFVDGLSDTDKAFIIEDPILNDPVARPYMYCEKRGVEILNGTRVTLEIHRFQETHEFKQVQENVQRRTGLTITLTPSTIMGIYNLCRFYRSYDVLKRSPWCSLFSDDDLKVLEYVEDVIHYFENGYGDEMNSLAGASGLRDLYQEFDRVHSTGHKSLTAYFSHDTMIQMLYSAMGLYRDYPQISGYERTAGRKWRTSFMTPFAANFVAVLHRCSEAKTNSDNYRIQFFVNEKEFHLCENRVCTWDEFRGTFEKFSNATLEFCKEFSYDKVA